APREVKGVAAEIELARISLDEADVREIRRAPLRLGEQLGNEIDAHHLRDERREREGKRARAGAHVERPLVTGERQKPPQIRGQRPAALLLELGDPRRGGGEAPLEGVAHRLNSRRTRSSASSRVEIVPTARSSAIRSSACPMPGPAGSPSSSPRRSGSDGSAALARSTASAYSDRPWSANA